MNDHDRKMEVATFRFGIISEFVTGVKLTYGEKEKLIKSKISRSYQIPYSDRSSISRSAIISWVNDYKKAGYRIDGLSPKERKDKGTYKKLSPTLRIAIKEMKKENPKLTVPVIIKKLKHKKLIPMSEEINYRSVYSYIKNEKLSRVNEDAVDRRRFEAEAPNEIWQSDVMHGPHARIKGINKKTYLCAIIDDHSRMIMNAKFYSSETLDTLKNCLRTAVETRGLPQKFYVDNGACYRALNLEQITASLGIALKHSRPYTPQGRGKIERWFRNVRDNFLPFYTPIKAIEQLNEQLESWVDEYNNTIHSSLKETPYDRYKKNLECVRPAPPLLLDYFRIVDFRRVKTDRTFRLNGVLFEAPVPLISKKIEVRYHEDDSSNVEVFFNNQSFGFADKLDPHVNFKVGRRWKTIKHNKKVIEVPKTVKIKSGQLFKGKEDESI
ncbi:MAG: transposase [Candidatus Brocadiales bacterium]|nr:transposase [Candidatus Brocadiales bacterium]